MFLSSKKCLCIAFIILGTNIAYANANEDIAFLNELYKNEKYELAKKESKRFILNYPESKYNKNISLRLAKIYFMEKNYTESEKYFYNYLNDYKLSKNEKREAYSYLYQINMVLKDYTRADEMAVELSKDKKLYEQTLFQSGVTLLNEAQTVESIKEFSKVIQFKGKFYSSSLLFLGMGLYNNNQYEESLKYLNLYNELNVENKNYPLLVYLYGSTYYKLNDLNNAINYFEQGSENYPNNVYTKKGEISLIEIYTNRMEIDKALAIYSKLKSPYYNKLGARVLGDYFLSRGDNQKAIEYYDIIGNDKKPATIYTYGYAHYKLSHYQKAINEFAKIREGRYALDARYYEILSFYELKDYKKALSYENYLPDYKADYKKYLDVETIFASSYYELKDYKKSYEYYKNIYEKEPNLSNLYRILVLENDCNNFQDFTISFEKYKEDFKMDEEYRKNIYLLAGNFYYKEGKADEAIEIYKEYMEKDKDVEVGKNLIDILINEKKYKLVLEYIKMLPENNDNLYLKGIAYMGIGKYSEADKIFKDLKTKEDLDAELKEKISYNIIKNDFLWEKYNFVIEEGNRYLESSYMYGLPEIVDRIGLSYYRIGNYAKSREIFEKLLVIDESKEYAEFQIAETYYGEKNYKKAKEEYQLCYLAKNPKYREEAKYWSLNCDLNLKDYKEYMKNSEEFLKEFKNSSYRGNIILMRGEILVRSGENDEAIKEYKTLYETTNDVVAKDGIIEKIIVLYSDDNEKEKLDWMEKFNDKYKRSYYKSLLYRKKGDRELANVEEKILLDSKEYKDYAIMNISEDDFYNKNYDEAEKGYAKIREMDSSLYKDIAIYRMGEISFIKNEYDNSILDFTKLIMLYPNSPYVVPAKLKIADAYFESKNYDEAEKNYKEVLNLKKKEYNEYIVDKLLFISLQKDNMEEAKTYYEQLKNINLDMSKKYDEFFKEEE